MKYILNLKLNFINENIFVKSILISVCFLPLILLLGSAIINFFISIISLCILILFFKKEKNIIFDKFSKYLFFINIALIFLFFFSHDLNNSFARSFGFVRFILFAYGIKFIFEYKNSKFKPFIFNFWTLFLFIISFDLIFEFITGKNSFGYGGYMDGRLSGFLNDELKIGLIILSFSFLISTYMHETFKKKWNVILVLMFFLFISLIVGERANFIRFIFCFFLFLMFIPIITKKTKFLTILVMLLVPIGLFNFNESYKFRYGQQFFKLIANEGTYGYIKSSQYGAHYVTAYEIFKNFPLTGVGIKNFPLECSKEQYYKVDYIFSDRRCSTHPHQIHLEILSTLGLPFYIVFILFFLYFFLNKFLIFYKEKNGYLLVTLIYLLSFLLLPIPTGSFFTTYTATMFWMNFGISNSNIKN